MEDSTRKTDILASYKPAQNDDLNKVAIIKKFYGKTDRHDRIKIYTDGSVNGHHNAKDGRSFAGWGFYYVNHFQDGSKSDGTRYGNLFNATPREAELKALLEAIKFCDQPKHFEIVSDCSEVVDGLKNIHERVSEFFAAQKISLEHKTGEDKRRYKTLQLWNEINSELKFNENIVSMQVKWVRSHTLDKHNGALPTEKDFEHQSEKNLITDILGNEKADKVATLGAIKAIRGSLFYYVNIKDKSEDIEKSVNICKKNFAASSFARDEAIRFLSQQPENFLPQKLLSSLLDKKSISRISHVRKQIKEGKTAMVALNGIIKNKKIIAFGHSKNKTAKDFMEKCRKLSVSPQNREMESSANY